MDPSTLAERGFGILPAILERSRLESLGESVFRLGVVGTRCLLDEPDVAAAARSMGSELRRAGFLEEGAVAIQAIAFDKSPEANWKVTWHQDLMYPFARRVSDPDYGTPSLKDGVNFARPPIGVLERLLAVRVHLDDCDGDNGPLKVARGTHRAGIIASDRVQDSVRNAGEFVCVAAPGEALALRPLLLHASSKATVPRRRRVLHLVYYDGPAMTESWHRAVVL